MAGLDWDNANFIGDYSYFEYAKVMNIYAVDLDSPGQWREAERRLAVLLQMGAVVDAAECICPKCSRYMGRHHREYWEDSRPRWATPVCPSGERDFGGFIDHTRHK